MRTTKWKATWKMGRRISHIGRGRGGAEKRGGGEKSEGKGWGLELQ